MDQVQEVDVRFQIGDGERLLRRRVMGSSLGGMGGKSRFGIERRRASAVAIVGALLGIFLGAGSSAAEDLRSLTVRSAIENGDVNGDWDIDLSDAIYTLQYLYTGGPAPAPLACGAAIPTGRTGDANGDGEIDLSDGVYVLSHLFTGGTAPVEIGCAWSAPEGGGAARRYEFFAFDVPAELGNFTSAYAINDWGAIVGNFFTVDENIDGFVFFHGRFTDVAVPGASPDDRGSLLGVNDLGVAVGSFADADTGIGHMFLRGPRGTITVLPDAAPGALFTEGSGINNHGTIVGIFLDADENQHGFIRRHGVYTPYDYPGALQTRLLGVNDRGQVVGFYMDEDRHRHGFMLDDGVTTVIDVPGAPNTRAVGINDRGQVVGFYGDASIAQVQHGFLFEKGVYTTLDFPGTSSTVLTGINNWGVIVGTYDVFSRGLVARPSR